MIRPPAIALLALLSAGAALAGTLEIETQPGVAVHWEGVHLATTDADGALVVEDVPPGPFEVTLTREGYEQLVVEVEIGEGTTRLSRQLRSIPDAPPFQPVVEAEREPSMEAAPPSEASKEPTGEADVAPLATPEVPAVRVAPGAWLAGIALLAIAAALVLRSRLKTVAPAPPVAPRAKPTSRVIREPPEPKTEGGFLSELRQRERALDDLVDVASGDKRGPDIPEPDVVDVAWKEID